jgi:hypothetical protein
MIKWSFAGIIIILCTFNSVEIRGLALPKKPLKILHLSFHSGCINDLKNIAKELNWDLESWYILSSQPQDFDGYTINGCAIYNIGEKRAHRVWEKHKEHFNKFDIIITSDTAPLSRIFLQNGWTKPLIIWICNRFDYADFASLDCKFPDKEYYNLFQKAAYQENVKIISYTPYEYYYASLKGLNIGARVIKPAGDLEQEIGANFKSSIPLDIDKSSTFFINPRMEPWQIDQIKHYCAEVGIKTWSGRYNGPEDIKEFKGIIFFPYAWSNLSLFENMQRGIVHFVPSLEFIKNHKLYGPHLRYLTTNVNELQLCELYAKEYKSLIVYFDSWQDLKKKIKSVDYHNLKLKIKKTAQEHRLDMIIRWNQVFQECTDYLSKNK